MEFEYITHLVPGVGCRVEEFETRFKGCECVGECLATTNCSCLLYKKDTYTEDGLLIESAVDVPIIECSEECACALNERPCNNRCVQLGVTLPLEVFATRNKGRGLRCRESIRRGRFVIEYIGEVVGAEEVQRRVSPNNYVLTVNECFGAQASEDGRCTTATYIDPSRRGNLARFINHSCNPNLKLVAVRVGSPLVHVALFADKDIRPFEELTYDYGESALASSVRRKPCHCESENCRRFLPASATATS
ncbi:putative histone-lysine N-methyltransferase set-23 [Toxocara canis]|uniref:Putative histone-lysine N-methyltransferase set-23 n=2 Tax=Toxocara canis TaxID=6265 RepID=A0A0B2VWD7_TOXCA|nr:putative histone-lysine N-methyltransferase set-23 [Toxocara canis]VDM36730.1 unnamed protein product [Toxocara canis]